MKILNLKTNEQGRGINVKYFRMWMDSKSWSEQVQKCRDMVIYYDCTTESENPMLSNGPYGWGATKWFGGYQGLIDNLTENNNTLFIDLCADYDSIMENKDPLNHSYLVEMELQKLSDSSRIIRNYDPLHWHKYTLASYYPGSDEDYPSYTKIPTSFNRLFVSQNMRGHYHRCYLLDYMANLDLIKKGYVTWNGIGFVDNHSDRLNMQRNINPTNYSFQHWEPELLIYGNSIPTSEEEIRRSILQDTSTQIPYYRDAFMDVVSESNPQSLYFTEKTARPILQLRPFLVQSCVNAHAILKEKFGYEQFDELFDYSFDSTQSNKLRTYQMLQQVNRYRDASMDDLLGLYKSIIPKLVHNFISLWKMPERTPTDLKWTEFNTVTADRKNTRNAMFKILTNTLKEQKLL